MGFLNVSDVREIYIVLLYLICIKLCGFCLCIIVFYWLLSCSYIVRYVFNRLKNVGCKYICFLMIFILWFVGCIFLYLISFLG